MRRLLIRPGGIGDCITCFPAMAWLCAEYTEVWVPSPVVPLVQFAHRVRAISHTGLDLIGLGLDQIPAPLIEALIGFDEIVSWYGSNRPEFRTEVRQLNPNWRFLPALPPVDHQEHVTDYQATLVGAPRGLFPNIQIAEEVEPRNTIAIHPFSGGRAKNWPFFNFQELAQQLPLPVEWTAGPDEQLDNAVRFGNLRELGKWIGSARLYIGNDSGITHLAAAVGIPTLALFGASNPQVWAPRSRNVTVLAKTAVQSISVEEVLCAATTLLQPYG